MRIGLDGADFVHRLVDVGGHVGHAVLAVARKAPHAPAEDQDRNERRRHPEQHEERELPARHEEHDRRAGHHQRVANDHRQAVADHLLQQRRVVGEARDHLAGARRVEERGLEREDVVEHRAAQVRHHALAGRHHQVEAEEGRDRERERDRDHRAERLVEQPRVAAAKAVVDHVLEALAQREHATGRDHEGDERGRDPRPVGLEEPRQARERFSFERQIFSTWTRQS